MYAKRAQLEHQKKMHKNKDRETTLACGASANNPVSRSTPTPRFRRTLLLDGVSKKKKIITDSRSMILLDTSFSRMRESATLHSCIAHSRHKRGKWEEGAVWIVVHFLHTFPEQHVVPYSFARFSPTRSVLYELDVSVYAAGAAHRG